MPKTTSSPHQVEKLLSHGMEPTNQKQDVTRELLRKPVILRWRRVTGMTLLTRCRWQCAVRISTALAGKTVQSKIQMQDLLLVINFADENTNHPIHFFRIHRSSLLLILVYIWWWYWCGCEIVLGYLVGLSSMIKIHWIIKSIFIKTHCSASIKTVVV